MRVRVRLAGTVLIAALLGGCHRMPAGQGWSKLVSESVLAEASLKYYWRQELRLPEEETVREIWRLGELLYAMTSNGRLIALDATSGTRKWEVKVAGPTQQVFRPCQADNVALRPATPPAAPAAPGEAAEPPKAEPLNVVVFNTLTYALVIDRERGKVMRRIDFTFAANTPCSTDGEHLYVASVKGQYYSIILDNGLIHWQLAAADLITASPIYYAGRLYVASQDHDFCAINPEREQDRRVWTQTTDGPLTAQFVVDARGCFVPGQDYKLYAFQPNTGQELPGWPFRTQGPLMQPVQVGQRTVYQYAQKDRFYAIDLANGRQRWDSYPARTVLATVEAGELPGVADKSQPHVLALTADGYLLVIAEILGNVEVRLPLTGLELFVLNATKPLIYAASTDGKVVCLAPKSLRRVDAQMLKD